MPYTLAAPVESLLDIKKSRFIGLVYPVAGRPEALAIVDRIWSEHPEATHVCWALLAGGHSAAADDGEPSGTAGRPMLEVLRHQELERVLAVVIRYFGGIKLGAGGLVRAYTDSVAQALLNAEKIPLRDMATLTAQVSYPLEGMMRRLIQQAGATLAEVNHGSVVTLRFTLPTEEAEAFQKQASEACHGTLGWVRDD